MQIVPENRQGSALSQQLLLTVAAQIKNPLLQIARNAELASLNPEYNGLSDIRATAEMALNLLDSYTLGVQLATEDSALFDVEPVSIASVLYDTAAQLKPIADSYDVELDLNIGGKYGPVMAHRQALQAALVSLGYALVEALPAQDSSQLKLQLSAHRCRYGIVAGLYCDTQHLTAQALRQGKQLHGFARQSMTDVSHVSGAGVFVADAILHAMNTQLKTSRHHKLHGLGAILQPNPQLLLV